MSSKQCVNCCDVIGCGFGAFCLFVLCMLFNLVNVFSCLLALE